MICAKNSNSVRANLYLVDFSKRDLDLSLDKTHLMYWKCLEVEEEYIKISSKYTVEK